MKKMKLGRYTRRKREANLKGSCESGGAQHNKINNKGKAIQKRNRTKYDKTKKGEKRKKIEETR